MIDGRTDDVLLQGGHVIDPANAIDGPADVLINLASTPPSFFARFERLAEIVAADEAQVQAGRERWRYYRERGYELRVHDLSERNRRADGA